MIRAIWYAAIRLRRKWYRNGRFRRTRLPCPVISVGGLAWGGTGKTTCGMEIVRILQEAGKRPAVVCRSYRGRLRRPRRISAGDDPAEVSDEAVLLARTLSCPVYAGPDKTEAARLAFSEASPDEIVVDDGFSHLSLERDLDILVLDGLDPFCSPGAPALLRRFLREPPDHLRFASAAVLLRRGPGPNGDLPENYNTIINEQMGRGEEPGPVFQARYEAGEAWFAGEKPGPAGRLQGRRMIGFCGIGSPDGFRALLEQTRAQIAEFRSFPDHCRYSETDLAELRRLASQYSAELVTTPKDAVRLPSDFPVWVLSPRWRWEKPGEFEQWLTGKLRS